jgi:DNA-binding transcriptional regulator YiaG
LSGAQARSAANAQQMLDAMSLNELRQVLGLSQKMRADVLHVQQPAIAKNRKICAVRSPANL